VQALPSDYFGDRQNNEIGEKFVFGFVSGLIGAGVAGLAAPLLARRRAIAAGQIAFG
jgi:hypothetical protein